MSAASSMPAQHDTGLDADYWLRWKLGEIAELDLPGRSKISVEQQLKFCREHVERLQGPMEAYREIAAAGLKALRDSR